MKSWGSCVLASQQTKGTFSSARNFGTSTEAFREESTETRTTATSFAGKLFDAATRSGISSRHGTHQVAQKLTTRTLPLRVATTRDWYWSGLRSFAGSAAARAGTPPARRSVEPRTADAANRRADPVTAI